MFEKIESISFYDIIVTDSKTGKPKRKEHL